MCSETQTLLHSTCRTCRYSEGAKSRIDKKLFFHLALFHSAHCSRVRSSCSIINDLPGQAESEAPATVSIPLSYWFSKLSGFSIILISGKAARIQSKILPQVTKNGNRERDRKNSCWKETNDGLRLVCVALFGWFLGLLCLGLLCFHKRPYCKYDAN
jgi:hypothetical protein